MGVKEAHHVLSCRHYSLYDIRIDANEQPYILEAALFCSFAPLSVIPTMANQAGREDLIHPKLFHDFLERAASEKKSSTKEIDVERAAIEKKASAEEPLVDEEEMGA